MGHNSFRRNLVKTKLINSNREYWRFQKSKFRGIVYEYEVEDRNFQSPCKWIFKICVPDKFQTQRKTYISVKPTQHPQKSYWAGIERQEINFARATTRIYRKMVYAKLNIPDVTGKKNKIGMAKGERSSLPVYIRNLSLRLKKTVASTRGTDNNYQVVITQSQNHQTMIRIFFALKVWVMYEKFSPV